MSNLRLTVVNAGPLKPDKSALVAFSTDGKITVPTTVGIIEHAKHGLIMWDTGINDAVADLDRRDAYWGPGLAAAFDTSDMTRDHAVDRQLQKLGHKTEDVKYVIYSHLHLDHAGGMVYFPNAVHIAQRDEIRYALWPDPWTKSVFCQNDYGSLRSLNVMELDSDVDLFDDGTIRLIRTPGHTPGHQALMLNLPNRGRVVLGADVGHQRDGYLNMVPMPFDWSVSAMTATRKRMQHLERSGVPVFLCHEPEDFAKLPINGAMWD